LTNGEENENVFWGEMRTCGPAERAAHTVEVNLLKAKNLRRIHFLVRSQVIVLIGVNTVFGDQ
jgi:hypothetical protein